MAGLNEWNRYGEEIKKRMLLRTSPIAIKMPESESDIPEGELWPEKMKSSFPSLQPKWRAW